MADVNDVFAKMTDGTNKYEQETNHEAQGSTTTSFRGELKVLSKRNEKGKKTKKQRMSASIDDIGDNSQMCLDE
jgi:hypothetical protein